MATRDDGNPAHPAARAIKAVEARAAAKEEQVADYYARQEGLQPTPTQAENDRAKVGAMTLDELDNKEDDGSEWEEDGVRRVMEARLPGNNPYDTRAIDAGTDGAAAAPRRGRRAAAKEG